MASACYQRNCAYQSMVVDECWALWKAVELSIALGFSKVMFKGNAL